MLSALVLLPVFFVLAVIIYCGLRLIGIRIKFEAVFTTVGVTLLWGPVLALFFVTAVASYAALGLLAFWLLYQGACYLLLQLGIFPYVAGWQLWVFIPQWIWILAAAIVGGALIGWLFEKS